MARASVLQCFSASVIYGSTTACSTTACSTASLLHCFTASDASPYAGTVSMAPSWPPCPPAPGLVGGVACGRPFSWDCSVCEALRVLPDSA